MIKFGIRDRVKILDLREEDVQTLSLEKLFIKYWPNSEIINPGSESIYFRDRIKIQSDKGWTDLLSITREKIPSSEFYWHTMYVERYTVPKELIPSLPKMALGYRKIPISQVTFTTDSNITIFDTENPIELFHGHIAYRYQQVNPVEYENKGYIKYKDDDEGWKFAKYQLHKEEWHPKYDSCYYIETKSGFANVSEFCLNVNSQ